MSKPRSDSLLKNLPEPRQEQIIDWCDAPKTDSCVGGYQFAREQLEADGVKVSLRALSDFWSWWYLRQDLEISFEREEQVLVKTGDARKAREAGETLLMRLGLAKQDPDLILAASKVHDSRRSLDLQEESGKTRAAHKERALDQKDQEIEMLQMKCAESLLSGRLREKADEINASNLSNADKIAAMRHAAFAEIDALQATGKVVIPR